MPIIVEETPPSGSPGPPPAGLTELYVLDPVEVAIGRTELDITAWVQAEGGIDWGDGEIAAYMADAERGQVPVDFRVPNRTIQIPLVLKTMGAMSFDAIRSSIQAKVALFQRQGGWIKRTTAIGTVFADVVNASLKLGGSWYQAAKGFDVDAVLVLECIPDFYGAEVDLGDNVETTAAELIFTETGIVGDYPGRMRIVVDEDDAEIQLGLIWGLRSRFYSAASTARLAYEAEALDLLDTAFGTALTGASGGTVVRHGTLSTDWTPVVGTDIGGTASLTHTGTYRWWARVYTTTDEGVQVRGVWDVGDLTLPVENTPQSIVGDSFYAVDLGEVRLDPVPVGTHRWQGAIQAKGMAGGENISIDRIWFAPVDEGYGILRAPINADPGFAASHSARDEFNQAAGALAGEALPVGGTWAGAGDVDDFDNASGGIATRTAVSDASGIANGRFETASTSSLTAVAAQMDFKRSANGLTVVHGLVLRYTSATQAALARVYDAGTGTVFVNFTWTVSGTWLGGFTKQYTAGLANDVWYTLRVMLTTGSGRVLMWLAPTGGSLGDPVLIADTSSVGGVPSSGRVGIYDQQQTATASTRSYDNFLAWAPVTDAVLHASRSAELRTEGIFREDSAGTAYGPVSYVVGDLPRIPGGGTTEIFLKGSRGDFGQLPDAGIDNISARVYYRPSWLFVPGT